MDKKMNNDTFIVVEVDPILGDYFIKENKITVSDYSEDDILKETKPFGYNSMQQIEEIYGEGKNQIIAECFAENCSPSSSDKNHKCPNPQELKEKLKSEYGIEWTLGDSWFEEFEE